VTAEALLQGGSTRHKLEQCLWPIMANRPEFSLLAIAFASPRHRSNLVEIGSEPDSRLMASVSRNRPTAEAPPLRLDSGDVPSSAQVVYAARVLLAKR
jgi:hypothetical protein